MSQISRSSSRLRGGFSVFLLSSTLLLSTHVFAVEAAPEQVSAMPEVADSVATDVEIAPIPRAIAEVAPTPSGHSLESDQASQEAGTDTTLTPPAVSPAIPSTIPESLPHDLSPKGMFMAADWVVKAVMIGLLFASLVTWTVWVVKTLELRASLKALAAPLASLSKAATLSDILPEMKRAGPALSALTEATLDELVHSSGLPVDGIKERVAMRLQRIEAAIGRKLNRGTGVLATIGSTAPFVGLFGTVWGIMNAFIGISKAQTTNLSIVAPGIAEALLATALGLVAAIPAVMIYNVFARALIEYRGRLADLTSEIQRVNARDLDKAFASAVSDSRTEKNAAQAA